MSERRGPMVVLAVVVLAGLGFVVWKLQSGGDESRADATSSEQAVTDESPSSGGVGGAATERPALPEDEGTLPDTPDPDGLGTVDPRVAPGTVVVDNRGREATGTPPNQTPQFVVSAAVIREMRRILRAEVKQCQKDYSDEIGEDARISGQLGVSISQEQLTVIDLQVDHAGVPESGDILECARTAMAQLQMPVPGHEDVKRHVIRFPFHLPLP